MGRALGHLYCTIFTRVNWASQPHNRSLWVLWVMGQLKADIAYIIFSLRAMRTKYHRRCGCATDWMLHSCYPAKPSPYKTRPHLYLPAPIQHLCTCTLTQPILIYGV